MARRRRAWQGRAGQGRGERGTCNTHELHSLSLPWPLLPVAPLPELLTFTSAWRATHVQPLSHIAHIAHCPAVHRPQDRCLTFGAVDVATFGRIKCAATPGDISSKTSVQMGDGNQRTSKFNVQLCPCSTAERETETETGREGERQRARHKDIVAASASVKTLPATELCHLLG